jgi:hypothetical protein
VTPSTPPEEREMREENVTTTVESIKTLEVECAQLYTETMGVWTQLSEDKEQQEISQKIQAVQEKVQKFKDVMGTLPPTEVVTAMNENKKLYSEMNQLRVEQQARTQQIEVLQEEAYRVTNDLNNNSRNHQTGS